MDELSIFLSAFSENFDVIVLTETFQVYDSNIFNMQGYNMLHNQGKLNKNDGVFVFLKSNLEFSHESIQIGEINALKLILTEQGKRIIITAVYRSPSTCPYNFNMGLLSYFDSTEKTDVHIFVGDININLLSNTDYSEEYQNILDSHGFISYIV